MHLPPLNFLILFVKVNFGWLKRLKQIVRLAYFSIKMLKYLKLINVTYFTRQDNISKIYFKYDLNIDW